MFLDDWTMDKCKSTKGTFHIIINKVNLLKYNTYDLNIDVTFHKKDVCE